MEDKYIKRLLEYPERFNRAVFSQQWSKAKYIYDSAIKVAEFLGKDLPVEIKWQLFGNPDEDSTEQPLFNLEWVNEAYDTCCIKLYQDYAHESFRRYGQPPQYYPAPRYPVPGYEKE